MGLGITGHGAMPLMPIVWMLLVFVQFAIGNYFLAQRLGKPAGLWVVLTLIPIVNYVFMLYVGYFVLYAVLDRLEALRRP